MDQFGALRHAAGEGLQQRQILARQAGENLPFSLARADDMLSHALGAGTAAGTVREHVHVTICGYTTVPPFQCALAVFGADRMLFSVDYPGAIPPRMPSSSPRPRSAPPTARKSSTSTLSGYSGSDPRLASKVPRPYPGKMTS